MWRARLLWSEINGAGVLFNGTIVERANTGVKQVPGILASDSRGCYDAVEQYESAGLGMKTRGHRLRWSS